MQGFVQKMIKKTAPVLALLCTLSLLAACIPYEVPSYVGEWHYESSEPDLGPDYAGSWVRVDEDWNYLFYDAPTGQRFTGKGKDFTHGGGLTITLTTTNDSGTRVYEAELQYLKDDKMIVKTASVNGVPTVIRFYRVRHRS